MERLLVVNSFGPMASSLVAALAEKFGYSNVPMRKLSLNKYITGELPLSSGVMQRRLRETLVTQSRPIRSGGVSVIDRDAQKPAPLVDITRVEDRLREVEAKTYSSVADLFSDCHEVYSKALVYKTDTHTPGWHVELCVDFHRSDARQLYDGYQRAFPQVHFVHLTREFRGWINALASQAMHHPDIKRRLKFFPHNRYKGFRRYEKAVETLPGLHFRFDDIFDTPIEDLAQSLAEFTGLPMPDIDLRQTEYDLYGELRPHSVTFTRFDDGVSFLSPDTLDRLDRAVASGRITSFPTNIALWTRYLRDLSAYQARGAAGR